MEPVELLQESQGRFLALHEEFLDPVRLPAGTRITVELLVIGRTSHPGISQSRILSPRPGLKILDGEGIVVNNDPGYKVACS